MNNNKNTPVAISRADGYDTHALTRIIKEHFDALGIGADTFSGKKVVIKPNLIMKKGPEYAATTAPEILDAVLTILDGFDCASVTIAESSGGPYTKESLEGAYRVCKIKDAAKGHKVSLNFDTSFTEIEFVQGKLVKKFNIITPINEADVIINLPRLKTHSLTGMSGAVKNFFGVIPGLQKFEMHARFPDYNDFSDMLCDLCSLMMQKTTVNILDAIVGMEGNGPTGGKPRKIGCLLTSQNPFNLDIIAKELICAGEVLSVKEGISRELSADTADDVTVIGDGYKDYIVRDFARPDSKKRGLVAMLSTLAGGRFAKFFSPRPVITKRCIGCAECERSCPQKTIHMEEVHGKKKAVIDLDRCIKCFCCQELCPKHAIDVKKNGLVSFVNRTKKR